MEFASSLHQMIQSYDTVEVKTLLDLTVAQQKSSSKDTSSGQHLQTMMITLALDRLKNEATAANPSLQQPLEGSPYDLCLLSEGNIGCVANRDIGVGELLLDEAPIVIGNMTEMRPDRRESLLTPDLMSVMEDLDERLARCVESGDMKKVQSKIWELWVDAKVAKLNDEDKRMFWSLHDSLHEVRVGEIVQIAGITSEEDNTNMMLNGTFALALQRMEKESHDGDDDDTVRWQVRHSSATTVLKSTHLKSAGGIVGTNQFEQQGQQAVFNHFARFNHSCAPNIWRKFVNDGTNRVQAVSSRNIAKGEELCLCYSSDRNKLKMQWGFDCACISCKERGLA